MRIRISCQDKYEAQKLASLLYLKESNEIFITAILNVIENELIVGLKDKSAHSILLKDEKNTDIFVDFIQSVMEKEHKVISTVVIENEIEIVKG